MNPQNDPVAKTNVPTRREWHGFATDEWTLDDRACLLVRPKNSAPSAPWIWRTEFFGHEPQADIALLERGFHVAYIDVQNMYGAPIAMRLMSSFYRHVTREYALSERVTLEGFSRGGLFALNWAIAHPDKVACLYWTRPFATSKAGLPVWGTASVRRGTGKSAKPFTD
jgi:pimeloyl-ACP methyl ester carboxylesterase